MNDKFRDVLLTEVKKKVKVKIKVKESKMLAKLHMLDDQIEDFIESLEDKINGVKDNPVFVKKAHQLIADMSKEYSEFIMAIRAVVNAVDRKNQVLPKVDNKPGKVRDVNSNKRGPDDDEAGAETEPQDEEVGVGSPSGIKEALQK